MGNADNQVYSTHMEFPFSGLSAPLKMHNTLFCVVVMPEHQYDLHRMANHKPTRYHLFWNIL